MIRIPHLAWGGGALSFLVFRTKEMISSKMFNFKKIPPVDLEFGTLRLLNIGSTISTTLAKLLINLGIRTESHITLVVLVLLYYLLVEGFLRFLWILTRKPIRDLTIWKCFKNTVTILLGINLFNFKQFWIINKRSTTLYRLFGVNFRRLVNPLGICQKIWGTNICIHMS